MYVGDSDWQTLVADIVKQPGSIALLQAGETQGLRWEIGQIGQVLNPEQVLLFVPFGLWNDEKETEDLYSVFRAWAGKCLGTRLPRKIGQSCFIYFVANPAWQAHVLDRDQGTPHDHALADFLKGIQQNAYLWPRRSARNWTVLNVILLLVLLSLLCIVPMLIVALVFLTKG